MLYHLCSLELCKHQRKSVEKYVKCLICTYEKDIDDPDVKLNDGWTSGLNAGGAVAEKLKPPLGPAVGCCNNWKHVLQKLDFYLNVGNNKISKTIRKTQHLISYFIKSDIRLLK